MSNDLQKVLRNVFEAFEGSLKDSIGVDAPTQNTLEELAVHEAFTKCVAQLPFRAPDRIGTGAAKAAFKVLGPPHAEDMHFDAAWLVMGIRFKTEIAQNKHRELRNYLDFVQREASDENV